MSLPLVLLVDDAPDLALIVERLGRRCGQAVVPCPDAESAWQRLQDLRPDLILLDLNLPGASGTELCRRLRADSRFRELSVAAFCHLDRPDDVAACLEAGADYFVSKDLLLDPPGWAARLGEILARKHGRPDAVLLSWMASSPPVAAEWATRWARVLDHPAVRPLGPAVLGVVVRRALQQVGFASGRQAVPLPDLVAEALRELCHRHPGVAVSFVLALAHGLWCLLGTAGCEPLRPLLAAPSPADGVAQ